MERKARKIFFMLLVSSIAKANEQFDHLNIDLSATRQLSDNGKRQAADADKIDEQQSIYNLGADYNYRNDWSYTDIHYNLSKWIYDENSQPDYTSLDGNAEVNLGNSSQPFNLNLRHSSRSLLNSPEALNISSNRDDRSITSAAPSYRWRLTGADSLQASYNYSNVGYDKQTQKNSESSGGEIAWLHAFSRIDTFKLVASTSKVTFKQNPLFDYKFENIQGTFSTDLRHLHYSISIGGNRAIQNSDDEDFSRASYDINASYSDSIQTVKLFLSQKITNSSMGNGNSSGLVGTNFDATSPNLDLINLKTSGISWSTSKICERCTLDFAIENNNEEYRSLPESSNYKKIRSAFSYRLSRRGIFEVSYMDADRKFEESTERNFKTKSYQVSYAYSFLNNMSLNAFATKYDSSSASTYNAYSENIVGLTLRYSF